MRTRDENKESAVRQKALEMLVNEGFDGFSMQKLAKAAGVSPATLYIYYKDKEDLIIRLGIEEGNRMVEATLRDFSPKMTFEEGLRIQWQNRAKHWLEFPIASRFFEQLKYSPYRDKLNDGFHDKLKENMSEFVKNAVKNSELKPMSVEVFWSVAYAPLYNLINFHYEGRSIGNRPFVWQDDLMEQTLQLVLKAFRP